MNLSNMPKLSTRARIIIAATAVLALVVVVIASAYAGAPAKEWAIGVFMGRDRNFLTHKTWNGAWFSGTSFCLRRYSPNRVSCNS